MQARPERTLLAPGLEISRLVCGLWQVADIEKDGSTIDPEQGADALQAYVQAGFDTFDMADHYGSAEIITEDSPPVSRLIQSAVDCKPPSA